MKPIYLANILCKIARLWSLISIGFVLLIIVTEFLSPHAPYPTSSEMVGIAFFPIGVLAGLILGWWREGLGGGIATMSLVGFYLWCYAIRGRWPSGPFFLAIAAPGIILLLVWAVRHRFEKELDLVK